MKKMNKILSFAILLLVGLTFPNFVNAAKIEEAKDIENGTYIIGTHKFTFGSELTTPKLMLAARTIVSEEEKLEDMIIYFKDLNGEWINGVSAESIEPLEEFNITHIDMKDVLSDAKTNALNELEGKYNSYNSEDYNAENFAELTNYFNEGKEAINAATTIVEVNEALSNALTSMSAVSTMIADVNNLEELRDALKNETKTIINILEDIDGIEERLVIGRELTINGNGNTLTFTKELNEQVYGTRHGILINTNNVKISNLNIILDANNDNWDGVYGIQAYNVTGIVLEDISVAQGDAAIFVNSSEVKLLGTINVGGNEFGGIEVSQGKGLTKKPILTVEGTITGELLENIPYIWIDGEKVNNENVILPESTTLKEYTYIKGNKFQVYFIENGDNLVHEISTKDMLLSAIDLELKNIKLTSDITIEEKLLINYEINIDGNNKKIIGNEVVLRANNSVTKNLIIEGSSNYGLQIYKAENVYLENLTVNNSQKGGIYVNGSKVTVKNVILNNNVWGGIEVSQGDNVTTTPKLTVEGTITGDLIKNTPYIWIDNQATNDGWVVTTELIGLKHLVKNQLWFVKENSLNLVEVTTDGLIEVEESFKFVVKAEDNIDLYSLEIDHNIKDLPEFTVYASEQNPYGNDEKKDAFEEMQASVTYNSEEKEWTIDFGPLVTEQLREKGITIYIVIKNVIGQEFGSMDPTNENNTFKYTFN